MRLMVSNMCPSYGAFRPIRCSSHEGPDIARESMRKQICCCLGWDPWPMAMKSMKGTWLWHGHGSKIFQGSEDIRYVFNWFHVFLKGMRSYMKEFKKRLEWANSRSSIYPELDSTHESVDWDAPQLVQESCARIEPGAMAKNRPISASHGNWPRIRSEKSTPVSRVSSSFPWMSLNWKCQSNTIQDYLLCGFNMFQPPENHYIFIQWSISSIEMEIQIPKAIPKNRPSGKLT